MATHVYKYGSETAPYSTKQTGFKKLQDAIDWVEANLPIGETIIVHGLHQGGGTNQQLSYNENVRIQRPMNLVGEEWPIINGSSNQASSITIQAPGGTTEISKCEIVGGGGNEGGGINSVLSSVNIKENCIHNNNVQESGGGIRISVDGDRQAVLIESNHLHANSAIVEGGGGIYVIDDSSRSDGRNVVIRGNIVGPGNSGKLGGGIGVEKARVLIERNVILKNRANMANTPGRGGGIAIWQHRDPMAYLTMAYILYSSRYEGQAVIKWNHVYCNTAEEDGGGMAFLHGGSGAISQNTIEKNTGTQDAGGIYVTTSGNLHLQGGNSLLENVATGEEGGAIHATCGARVLFTGDNLVQGNRAGGSGGGVSIRHADLEINGATVIRENRCGKEGGGIYALTADLSGANEFCEMDCSMQLDGTLIEDNESTNEGGAICVKRTENMIPAGSYSINNCVIMRNKSGSSNHPGIYFEGSSIDFTLKANVIALHRSGTNGVGLAVIGRTRTRITKCWFDGNDVGVHLAGASPLVRNCWFREHVSKSLVWDRIPLNAGSAHVEDNDFQGNGTTQFGIEIKRASFSRLPRIERFRNNNIEGHVQFGLSEDGQPNSPLVVAERNWWGDPAGPTTATSGPRGDRISPRVDWNPNVRQRHGMTGAVRPSILLAPLPAPPQLQLGFLSEFFQLGCSAIDYDNLSCP